MANTGERQAAPVQHSHKEGRALLRRPLTRGRRVMWLAWEKGFML